MRLVGRMSSDREEKRSESRVLNYSWALNQFVKFLVLKIQFWGRKKNLDCVFSPMNST